MALLKRFAWVSTARLAAAVLQALTFIVIARESTPSLFGLFAAFMGVALVVHPLFDLGISSYVTRTRAEDPAAPEVAQALRLYRFLGMGQVSTLVSVGIAMSLVSGIAPFVFVPMAVASAIERQTDVRLGIALVDGDIWKNVTFQLIRRTVTLTSTLVLVQHLASLVAYGAAYVLGSTVGFVLGHFLIRVETDDRWHTASNGEILRISRPFWLNSLSAQLRNLDVLIVSVTASPAMAGQYGAIARAIGPLRMFSASLAAVIFPQAVRDRMSGASTVTCPILVVLGALLVVYAAMAGAADHIVVLLLGVEYLPAVDGLRIVLISLVFASLSSILTTILQAYRFERVVALVAAVISIFALGAIFVGSLLAGVTGAATGLALSYVIQAMLMFAFGGNIMLGCRRGKHV